MHSLCPKLILEQSENRSPIQKLETGLKICSEFVERRIKKRRGISISNVITTAACMYCTEACGPDDEPSNEPCPGAQRTAAGGSPQSGGINGGIRRRDGLVDWWVGGSGVHVGSFRVQQVLLDFGWSKKASHLHGCLQQAFFAVTGRRQNRSNPFQPAPPSLSPPLSSGKPCKGIEPFHLLVNPKLVCARDVAGFPTASPVTESTINLSS